MKFERVLKSKFLGSISILATGSIIANAVSFFLVPFITRKYTPEEFAVFTYILSIATIFMGIINCRYELAIIKAKNEENTFALIKGALFVGVIFAFVVSIICCFIFVVKDDFTWYHALYLLAFLLSYAVINVLTAYNNKQCEYKIIASVNFIRPIIQNAGALLLGFLPIGSHGLLTSYTTGQLLGISRQNHSLRGQWKRIFNTPNKIVLSQLYQNRNQLFYSTPAQLLNSFSYSSISLAIESLFGLVLLGYYSLSVRLLGLPLAVVSGNVSKVFYERAIKEYEERKTYRNTLKKTVLFLSLLAIPMVIIMMTVVPDLCGFFLGEEWEKAGEYICVLAPMFGVRFIVTAVSPALIIVNKQKQEMYLQALFVAFILLAYVATRMLEQDIMFFLICVSVLFSIGYLLYLSKIVRYSFTEVDDE